ncbi:hypothetical protein K7957_00155 [Sphingomonas yunnanensis]|uniref:hypothetical protein n=1 Tax=Sphingomonas yunnanensis TaxID=310400 RepID=UPI001CA69F3C|nr:hypothetical protein [Sphingomonas yunnanensis]MBY9061344.1 hypothetical protein [Sphingomonas yunnanensis]
MTRRTIDDRPDASPAAVTPGPGRSGASRFRGDRVDLPVILVTALEATSTDVGVFLNRLVRGSIWQDQAIRSDDGATAIQAYLAREGLRCVVDLGGGCWYHHPADVLHVFGEELPVAVVAMRDVPLTSILRHPLLDGMELVVRRIALLNPRYPQLGIAIEVHMPTRPVQLPSRTLAPDYMPPMIQHATPASPQPALGFHSAYDGGDWTTSWSDLVSYLIQQAESRYGPRDSRWFFTGVEFADVPVPCTLYTGNRPFHIGIQLTATVSMTPRIAHFQLAHEVVHLLGPSESHDRANVLEEGMAAAFQQEMSTRSGLGIDVTVPSYVSAMEALAELLTIDPDAVRRLRSIHPDLRLLDVANLIRIVPGADDTLADRLCSPFQA